MLELLAQEAGGPGQLPLFAYALFGVFVFMVIVVIFRGRA